jgi:hypothetical protein
MIEGNGHDTPEAGPSGWPLRGQRSNNELRRRYTSEQSTRRASSEEVLGWRMDEDVSILFMGCSPGALGHGLTELE